MSNEDLWYNFTQTGKIEDYMKYVEFKNNNEEKMGEIDEANKSQWDCN